MGRIFCLMGKSSSGKDTLYARLSEKLHFSTIVPYTTRPIREGEEEGREYHFITEKEVEEFEKQGALLSCVHIIRYTGSGNISQWMINRPM